MNFHSVEQELFGSHGHTSHPVHFAVPLLGCTCNGSMLVKSKVLSCNIGLWLFILALTFDFFFFSLRLECWSLRSHSIWVSHVLQLVGHFPPLPASSSEFVHMLRFLSGPLVAIKTKIWVLYFCSNDSFVSYTHWWRWHSLSRMCYLIWLQESKFGSCVPWPQIF